MKTRHIASVLLLGAAILTGCQKEMEILSSNLVRFEAGAAADAPVATKATYSGKFYDASGTEFDYAVQGYTERIDWTANKDIIRIYSPQAVKTGSTQHWDDYKVSAAAEDKEKSVATIAAAGGADTGLAWGAGSPQDFYAMFPAPGTAWPYDNNQKVQAGEAAIEAGTDGAVISGVIPASQVFNRSNRVLRPNMNYAYMYAKATGATPGSSVSLEFSPLVTVVTFTLQLAASNHFISGTTVNSIKLSTSQEGAYLSGKFSVPVTSAGLGTPVITEGSNEVSLAIGTALTTGQIMASNAPMTFTFFTLPTDQTKLTLTIGFSDGTSRTLDLKNGADWVSVPAGRKLFVNNLGLSGDDFYTISIGNRTGLGNRRGSSSVSVTSFVSKDYATTRTPVPWEIEGFYYDEACENPVDAADVWVTDLATNDNYAGTDATDRRSATLSFKYKFNDYNLQYLNQALTSNNNIANSSFGSGSSASNYYNLSNPGNMSSSTIVETANCYIVNGAGYYRIPLVVGNGIVGGSVNPNELAWKGRIIESKYEFHRTVETMVNGRYVEQIRDLFHPQIEVTTPFYDYKQQVIQNVYLHKTSSAAGTPTSAFVVWEDVDGMVEVADAQYTLPAGAITREGDVYWLNFHVAGQVQGNAVIAVADASGAVMWSWHIWETDYVPANYGSQTYADQSLGTGEGKTLMQRPLGYIYADYKTDERTIWVKVRQTVLGEDGTYHTAKGKIVQNGNQAEYIGRNPYYAWGRKDAFWPGYAEVSGENSRFAIYVTENFGRFEKPPYSSSYEATHSTGVKLGYLIQNPAEWRTWLNNFNKGYPELEVSIPFGPNHETYYKNGVETNENKQPGQVYAFNMWNALSRDQYGDDRKRQTLPEIVKTIYDPCPAGYHVPSEIVFEGLSGKAATLVNNNFIVNGIVFPATGYMQYSSMYYSNNMLEALYWGAEPWRRVDEKSLKDPDNPTMGGNTDNNYFESATCIDMYDARGWASGNNQHLPADGQLQFRITASLRGIGHGVYPVR